MKLCKVFEKELKQKIFVSWRSDFLKSNKADNIRVDENEDDFTLFVLINWLKGKHKIDLGNMKYILNRARANPDHNLFISLRNFIDQLPNKKFLLSENIESIIALISSRYRNGGVHEAMVSYSICDEAFQKILIEPDSALGLLLVGALSE